MASAVIAGAYEHPLREIPDRSVAQIHAEVALGALADAGLTLADVDGYFCDSTAPGGPLGMADYLGLSPRYVDSTDTGGSSYLAHVGHAADAIAAGRCRVALCTMAGRPRSAGRSGRTAPSPLGPFEDNWGITATVHNYALVAMRHMAEFGTTPEQLAAVKVAASQHAQYNPNALLRKVVTVEDVLASPMISDPLHRLDCCVVTDGGGAVVVVAPEVARSLGRTGADVLGYAQAVSHPAAGAIDLTTTAAARTGPAALAEAGVTLADVDYASIYDSFTITVVITLEDLGFCAKGEGGRFVEDGALLAPHGRLPINTDGGGLCNNHPSSRGGMTKIIEAVRQLRGTAHPAVQVPDCEVALVHGTGGRLGTRAGSVTLILGRSDR
ncbi:MAG TPA: thiolase domain-containing protein [Pseudonocardiaceae bacterium]|jgi:acetyl-CoA C-acetyltransferase|nr:thiolase domain-containing protein [Pseudonocardiaceae bacterium]